MHRPRLRRSRLPVAVRAFAAVVAASAIVLAAVAGLVLAGDPAAPAGAQVTDPSSPDDGSSSTTPETTEDLLTGSTTTTSAPVTSTTIQVDTSTGEGSVGAVWRIVIALVAVAVVLAALTIWYWRHTDPRRRAGPSGVEPKPSPPSAGGGSARTPRDGRDPVGDPRAGRSGQERTRSDPARQRGSGAVPGASSRTAPPRRAAIGADGRSGAGDGSRRSPATPRPPSASRGAEGPVEARRSTADRRPGVARPPAGDGDGQSTGVRPRLDAALPPPDHSLRRRRRRPVR